MMLCGQRGAGRLPFRLESRQAFFFHRRGGHMIKIAVITGSTRPGRKSLDVARWVMEIARLRSDAVFDLVDIEDFRLPLLDEPVPPSMNQYSKPHTRAWAAKVA